MRTWRCIVACAVAAGAIGVFGPASAAADNCGSSAGDSQYTNPLGCTPPPSGGGTTTSQGSGTSSQGSGSSGSTGSSPSSTAVASSTTAAATHPDPTSSKTLPYTGFDIWPVLGIGIGLVAAGLLLRRLSRSA